MTKFLNAFTNQRRKLSDAEAEEFKALFNQTVQLARSGLLPRPFRPERALNAAVFDSVMVGLASRLRQGPIGDVRRLSEVYQALIRAPD